MSAADGAVLAELAASVPVGQAIVEVGAHRGLSSCWLAYGSAQGNAAHVYSIDPWPLAGIVVESEDVPWAEEGAMERWRANIASIGASDLATPIQGRGEDVARTWGGEVGLWFHDADHSYLAVKRDYRAWRRHLASGCWVAVHDYWGAVPDGRGGWVRDGSRQRAVEDVILKSGRWTDVRVIGTPDGAPMSPNLWIGRWWK